MAVSGARKSAAADVMEHYADHDASHGYAQDARNGDGAGTCSVETAIGTVSVGTGDRDCTSGVASAYEAVGIDTGGATWTGNFLACMTASGNFRAHRTGDGSNCDDGYVAKRGDCYLAHNDHWQHAAMCTGEDPDTLAEFSINSQGGISGDPVGDQTGRECLVRPFYGGHWDYVMEVVADGSAPAPQPTAGKPLQADAAQPRYRTWDRQNGWNEWMTGLADSSDCGDDYAGEAGQTVYDVDVDVSTLGDGGWFQLTLEGGELLPRNQGNGAREKAVIGVTVYYKTADPAKTGYYYARYQVHWMGANPAWGKWEVDDEDGGAGNDRDPIDMLRLVVSR